MKNNLEKIDSRVFMMFNFMSEELDSIRVKLRNLEEWQKENPSRSLIRRVNSKNKSEYYVLQENFSKKPKQKIVNISNLKKIQSDIDKFKEKRKKVRDEINRLKELQNGMEKILRYLVKVFKIEDK